MIGTVDTLLFEINERFKLGIPVDRLEVAAVLSGMSAEAEKIDLMIELSRISEYGSWYWILRQFKNYSLNKSLITDEPLELRPNYRVQIKVIPYFEHSLDQLIEFMETIRSKE